jgi:predicted Zn-dependent protease
MIRAVLQRAALLIAAAAAVAWLANGLHHARLQERAQAIAARDPAKLNPADVRRAVGLFERARRGNPDRTPALQEAGLLARVGRQPEAIALLRELVRAEPENVSAWALLAVAAKQHDPALAAQARARARELAPPAPAAR